MATLNLYTGDLVEDGSFTVDPASFIDNSQDNGALISFDATLSGSMMDTSAGDFNLVLPLPGANVEVTLSQTKIKAALATAETGFEMSNGVIAGYFDT